MKITAIVSAPCKIYTQWNKMGYKKIGLHNVVFYRTGNTFRAENITPAQMEHLKAYGVRFEIMTNPPSETTLGIDIQKGPEKTITMISLKEWAVQNNVPYQDAYKKYKEGSLNVVKENGSLFVVLE